MVKNTSVHGTTRCSIYRADQPRYKYVVTVLQNGKRVKQEYANTPANALDTAKSLWASYAPPDAPFTCFAPEETDLPESTSKRLGQPIVYFLVLGSSHLKIGITTNIRARLACYETHSPHEITKCITYRVPGGVSQARAIEQWFGRWMSEFAIRREWFSYDEKAAARLHEGLDAVRAFAAWGEPSIITNPKLFAQ